MAFHWNIFRLLADVTHTSSKLILLWAIFSNRSAEGVSLITQCLYLLVFLARYLFIPWGGNPFSEWHLLWNDTLRIFYTLSSALTVLLMLRVFARTREKEKGWRLGAYSLGGSLFLAPFATMAFVPKFDWAIHEFSITFSLLLEAVCVLPQLLLLRQTSVPTVIDSYYLVALGAYRAFYLLNWLVQAITNGDWDSARRHPDPLSVICGLVQTALYVDFALVYWGRQRVKLRRGAVIDSDDVSKGWLIKRFIGSRYAGDEEDVFDQDHERDGYTPSQRGWGRRGISVSADDNVNEDVDGEREEEDGDLEDPARFEDALSENGRN